MAKQLPAPSEDTTEMICWDWKEAFPVDELHNFLRKFGLSAHPVESGGDMYAIVVGKGNFNEDQAQRFFDEHLND